MCRILALKIIAFKVYLWAKTVKLYVNLYSKENFSSRNSWPLQIKDGFEPDFCGLGSGRVLEMRARVGSGLTMRAAGRVGPGHLRAFSLFPNFFRVIQ